MGTHTLYHNIALGSVAASLLCLVILAITVPSLYFKSQAERYGAELKGQEFKDRTNAMWNELMSLSSDGTPAAPGSRVLFFSRPKRQFIDGNGFCKGCMTLTCPTGPPGPPGPPGMDGHMGEAGMQGSPGEDGFDVQLESEPELPCVVCSAGPPGPRGPQGERGRIGHAGAPGAPGPDGFYGKDGPRGHSGGPGRKGPNGPEGPEGPPGDMAVAGMGIKGPKGPPGPAGPKGRPGPKGKHSLGSGEPGANGEAGKPGPEGGPGEPGPEGSFGPPGEPGMPSSYCPSDCGVSHIVAGSMMTSGMLGEKMSAADLAQMAANAPMAHSPMSYGGYRQRDYVEQRDDDRAVATREELFNRLFIAE